MKSQRWYEDNKSRPQNWYEDKPHSQNYNLDDLNKIIFDLHTENMLLRHENWRLREEIIRLNTELAKYRI